MKKEYDTCFYCGALLCEKSEQDHFPMPSNLGGKITVGCCRTCHDMKDRFSLYSWPVEWISIVLSDFNNLSRETKIFLAKTIRYFEEAIAIINKSKGGCHENSHKTNDGGDSYCCDSNGSYRLDTCRKTD